MDGVMLARGTYGRVVGGAPGSVIKKTSLFAHSPATGEVLVNSANVVEAAAAAFIAHHKPKGVARYERVDVDTGSREINITMPRAVCDLDTAIRRMPYVARLQALPRLFRQLVEALHTLHGHGISHGDLKPLNILVTNPRPEAFDTVLIDLGSSRFLWHRSQWTFRQQKCTYSYAAPEMFLASTQDPLKFDAYSLGAVLFDFIHKRTPVLAKNTTCWDEAVHALRNAPDQPDAPCPDGVSPHLYAAVLALLHKDPDRRLTVRSLYQHGAAPTAAPLIADPPCVSPWGSQRARDTAIDNMYEMCTACPVVFALAVNLADRFACAQRAPCTPVDLRACVTLAMTLLTYRSVQADAELCESVTRVMHTLRGALYSETCDTLLMRRAQHQRVDYECLRRALKIGAGDTRRTLECYTATVDYVNQALLHG